MPWSHVEALPVGAIFLSTIDSNPAAMLGYGTWSRIGAGRVLVGLDTGDTDFDTAGETGGAKVRTPSAHAGTAVAAHSDIRNHTHPVTDPGHTHVVTSQTATTGSATSYEHGALDTSSA